MELEDATASCGVPDCILPPIAHGVCPIHRAEEMRVSGAPSGHELDAMIEVIREENAAEEARMRAKYASALKVDEDGWDGFTTRYGRRALEGILQDVQAAEQGRNNSLFKGAARLGGLVASGHVVESLAVDSVTAAGLATGLKIDEVRPTVRGAIAKGKNKPWGPKT